MPSLTNDNEVYLLDLGAEENRLHPDWMAEVNQLLDAVLAAPGPAALVSYGTGKFYSNGLDLAWLTEHVDQFSRYLQDVQALMARVVTLPVATIAAVNGHAFGAGAMLALAHDARLMRTDRGYFCFPEVDINLPFTPGMSALIQAKLPPAAAIASMTTGRRFGGAEAVTAGLVDGSAAESDLLAAAIEQVRPLAGKDRATLGRIKSTMFDHAVQALLGSIEGDSDSR
ncbi:MAG: enoyl-CoA hydratase/isomerase family protein [Jatrophihabitantaceae bacterium]